MKASDKVLNNIYRAQQLSGEKERLQLRPKECNSISACLKQYQYWNISLKMILTPLAGGTPGPPVPDLMRVATVRGEKEILR